MSSPQDLVRPCDIKGILHSHSRWTDGAHSLGSMVETAREIGLEYLGISDHFRSEAHQEGLDLGALKIQLAEIERLRRENPGFDVLQGIELDAEPDGSLPLESETLAQFDYVIVSFPENGGYDPGTFTEQVMRAAAHPSVSILAHPLGDLMLRQQNGILDMEKVLEAAAAGRTAVEVTTNPTCSELDWTHCRRAQELGVFMSISPNAHRAARLVDFRHGAERAREAGLVCASILNTLTSEELRRYWASGEIPS
ncbi:MAG: PHP domain-containing protein [bacterium]